MPPFCQRLKDSYEHLQKLTVDFTAKYHAVRETGDLTEVKRLRLDLERARREFIEQLATFTVPGALNPYYVALRVAGLDQDKTSERKEMRINIGEEIKKQLAVYAGAVDADGQPTLNEWIKDITDNETWIYAAVANDHVEIEARIKAGMIPVVMPSRSIQERTWKKAMETLKPTRIQNGKLERVEIHVDETYETDSSNKMTIQGFFKHIPDHPYLVWTKPSQIPDKNTIGDDFEYQREICMRLVDDHPDLYDYIDLLPTEYAALQAVFTSRVRESFKELQGGTEEPTTIKPLDNDVGASTRFLSAGTFVDRQGAVVFSGSVPWATFAKMRRRVHFGRDYPVDQSGAGVRLASRS